MSLKIITRGAVAVSINPDNSDLIVRDNSSQSSGVTIVNTSTNGDWAELTWDNDNSGQWIATTNGWSEGS
jgi:hypothetical protein